MTMSCQNNSDWFLSNVPEDKFTTVYKLKLQVKNADNPSVNRHSILRMKVQNMLFSLMQNVQFK